MAKEIQAGLRPQMYRIVRAQGVRISELEAQNWRYKEAAQGRPLEGFTVEVITNQLIDAENEVTALKAETNRLREFWMGAQQQYFTALKELEAEKREHKETVKKWVRCGSSGYKNSYGETVKPGPMGEGNSVERAQ